MGQEIEFQDLWFMEEQITEGAWSLLFNGSEKFQISRIVA